jgi:hypothetical protein
VVPAAGGKVSRVTDSEPEKRNPSWSRDGTHIYYSTYVDGFAIWRVPIEGGQPEKVTPTSALLAEESPDGKWLYYRGSFHGKLGIWRMPVDGGEPTAVVAGTSDLALVNKRGICVVTRKRFGFLRAGTDRLAEFGSRPDGYEGGLAVSPDGQWLLYTALVLQQRDVKLVENFR